MACFVDTENTNDYESRVLNLRKTAERLKQIYRFDDVDIHDNKTKENNHLHFQKRHRRSRSYDHDPMRYLINQESQTSLSSGMHSPSTSDVFPLTNPRRSSHHKDASSSYCDREDILSSSSSHTRSGPTSPTSSRQSSKVIPIPNQRFHQKILKGG